jgi:heme/copper-type cytochrome/quinol oxidase subunit 2
MNMYVIGDYLLCRLQGRSSDVLHSYSVLRYGVHTDCMPGKLTEHVVQVNLEGEEYVTCQELCGYGHSGMSIIIEL